MTWTAISAILAAIGLIIYQWVKSRTATESALDTKNVALEKRAADQREKERAEDEALAKEIVASGDGQRAIGFLRGSFGRASDPKVDNMPAPELAGPASS